MTEEWRAIAACPEYEVNRKGHIRRISDKRIVKAKPMKKIYGGYVRAGLYANGVSVPVPVHRAVAEAFIPNPDGKEQVHHLDMNPANNTVENLVWVTAKEHGLFHRKLKDDTF